MNKDDILWRLACQIQTEAEHRARMRLALLPDADIPDKAVQYEMDLLISEIVPHDGE